MKKPVTAIGPAPPSVMACTTLMPSAPMTGPSLGSSPRLGGSPGSSGVSLQSGAPSRQEPAPEEGFVGSVVGVASFVAHAVATTERVTNTDNIMIVFRNLNTSTSMSSTRRRQRANIVPVSDGRDGDSGSEKLVTVCPGCARFRCRRRVLVVFDCIGTTKLACRASRRNDRSAVSALDTSLVLPAILDTIGGVDACNPAPQLVFGVAVVFKERPHRLDDEDQTIDTVVEVEHVIL